MNKFFKRLSKHAQVSEITIAIFILLLLTLMIIPVPTIMMDFLLAMNFTGAMVVLFMAIYVFSVI